MLPHLNDREEQILIAIVQDPDISVTDLAARFSVSAVSMRGYLNDLAEKGYIYRIRGGAVPTIHPEIVEREQSFPEAKRAIAQAAAALVNDGDSVMIEAGTTTAMVARFLLGRRDVSVVTNNVLALAHARGNPGLRVTIVGGEFRPANESVVGPIALSQISMFRVAVAFVGTDGFSAANGLSTHLVEGAEVVRHMVAQSDRAVLLADSSKFERRGFVRVLGLADIDTIITDAGLSPDATRAIEKLGVEVILAGRRQEPTDRTPRPGGKPQED